MADMANVVVRDDATTPVDHVLIPISNADKNLVWRGDVDGVPNEGQIRLTAQWERQKDGTHRLSTKLEVPSLEVASGSQNGYVAAPKVAYVTVGIFTLFAPARSTNADRANVVRMLCHALAGATSTAGMGTSPSTSSGDVWKTMTAPLPFGYAHLAMPN